MTHQETERQEVMLEAKSFEIHQVGGNAPDARSVYRVEDGVVTLRPLIPQKNPLSAGC